jgi:hypothetical protein
MNKRQQDTTRVFLENHFRTKKELSPSIFLIGFNDNQLTAIEQQTVNSLLDLRRSTRIIDVENLSAKDIYCVINKEFSPTIIEAYEKLKTTFQTQKTVFIIKNLSKSKVPYKGHLVRKLVKALLGDINNNNATEADLIFIDDARLLESNWDLLNTHIISNYPGKIQTGNIAELLDYAFLYCN